MKWVITKVWASMSLETYCDLIDLFPGWKKEIVNVEGATKKKL